LAVLALLSALLAWFHWAAGLAGLILTIGVAVYSYFAERAFRKDLKNYLGTLSYRVKKGGNDVISELPFGIILYHEDRTVEWHNPYIAKIFERDNAIGIPLTELFPTLQHAKDRDGIIEAAVGSQTY